MSVNNIMSDIKQRFLNPCIKSQEGKQKEDVYDWDDKFDYSSGVIAFHWSLSRRRGYRGYAELAAESRSTADHDWQSGQRDRCA